jgi:monoamine oxidase
MRTKVGRLLIELACKGVWAAMPADVSLLHFLFYVRSAGSLELLLDTEGGAQQDRFTTGSQTVSLRLAEELGERVMLNSPARRILHSGDRATVEGDEFRATGRHVIVTLPPALAGRLDYDPPLPAHRDQLTQRYPMGSVVKWMAVYDEPFWRQQGYSGETTSTSWPVSVSFDNSPADGSPGIVAGFLEGREARTWTRATEAERRDAVVGCLERFYGPRAATPVDFIQKSWAEEPFSRGCYEGYTPPGVLTAFGDAIREPIGPIHWAGTETATVWNGYMEGAVRSGQRAAREILEKLG